MTAQAFTQGTMFGATFAFTTNTTLIGNIKSVDTAPELMRTAIETTYLGSTSGFKTFVPGDIIDPGKLILNVQYSTQLDYKTLFLAGCDIVTATFPKRATDCGLSIAGTAATWSSSVVFVKFTPSWPEDGQLMIKYELQCTGVPTYVAALV